MYNDELEGLISAALADGALTEKEKQILFRKAQLMGIDLDEFEMVLNARLQKIQRQGAPQSVAPQAPQPVVNKPQVRKCPACGAIIPSFSAVCPECGAELSNSVVSSVQKFANKLDELDDRRLYSTHEKEKTKINIWIILLWCFFYWIMIPRYIIKISTSFYREPDFDGTDRRKQDFILNAPVPNSKEDLLEFIILCTNRIENIPMLKMLSSKAATIAAWNNVWFKKLSALGAKTTISMKNDQGSLAEAQRLIEEANEKMENNKKTAKKLAIIGTVLILISILFFIFCLTAPAIVASNY